jgi:hypothetical protein
MSVAYTAPSIVSTTKVSATTSFAVPVIRPDAMLLKSRMGLLTQHGKIESFDALFPCGYIMVGGEKMTAMIYAGGGEVLIKFISFHRDGGGATESTVNGRTVYAAPSLAVLALVTKNGGVLLGENGNAKNYIAAAGQVMEARASLSAKNRTGGGGPVKSRDDEWGNKLPDETRIANAVLQARRYQRMGEGNWGVSFPEYAKDSL